MLNRFLVAVPVSRTSVRLLPDMVDEEGVLGLLPLILADVHDGERGGVRSGTADKGVIGVHNHSGV